MRVSTDFFLSFLAAIIELEENGREEMHFGIVGEEDRERDWKRWRRGETICRIELCGDAILWEGKDVCGRGVKGGGS